MRRFESARRLLSYRSPASPRQQHTAAPPNHGRHGRLVVALVAAGCVGETPFIIGGSALPDSLDGLARVQVVSGAEAQNLIAHLHPGPLMPAESEVGFYAAGDDRAVVYVSTFSDADTARAQLDRMSATIGRGRGGFGHHSETDMGGTRVHATLGLGRIHYFFARERDVVWLAAEPELARNALAALLRIPADSVPPVFDAER